MISDSTGKPIFIGDIVKFRGKLYTIKEFLNKGSGKLGTWQIIFFEKQHVKEIADEISVDFIKRDLDILKTTITIS